MAPDDLRLSGVMTLDISRSHILSYHFSAHLESFHIRRLGIAELDLVHISIQALLPLYRHIAPNINSMCHSNLLRSPGHKQDIFCRSCQQVTGLSDEFRYCLLNAIIVPKHKVK